jgi:O-antigen ligase
LFQVDRFSKFHNFARWAALVLISNLAISSKRSVQVGLFVGIVVLAFHLPWRRVVRYAVVAAIATSLFVMLLGINSAGTNATGVSASVSRYGEILNFIDNPARSSESGETLAFHLLDLVDVWNEIIQRPLLGAGFGSHYQRELTLLPTVGGEGLGYDTGMVHNTYLYIWWKMGVLGLFGFFGIIAGYFRYIRKMIPGYAFSETRAVAVGLYAAIWADLSMEMWGAQWVTNTKDPFVIFMALALPICLLKQKKKVSIADREAPG